MNTNTVFSFDTFHQDLNIGGTTIEAITFTPSLTLVVTKGTLTNQSSPYNFRVGHVTLSINPLGLILTFFFSYSFTSIMLALRHTVPKACTQLRACVQVSQRWTSSTTPQKSDEKPTAQMDGILSALGVSSKDYDTSSVLNENAKNDKKTSTLFALNSSFTNTLNNLNQSPHQLHINATFNNTIITLTRPNGAPLVTTSGGSAGFKKAARSGYEAAHQAAIQLLEKMDVKNLQVPNVHIVLKGFGPGRDAAFKALVSGTSWNVKRITDATPIPFGGCRPKKARRL